MRTRKVAKISLSIMLALCLVFGSFSAAFAGPGDYFNKTTQKSYTAASQYEGLIADILGGDDPNDFYEENDAGKYINLVERENAELNAVRTLLNENNINLRDRSAIKDFVIQNRAQVNAKVNEAKGNVEAIDLEEAVDGLAVTKVSAINDINVAFGGEYTLPTEVDVTLSDETVETVPVTWEDTVDVNVAGTYELEGTLDLSALEDVAATEEVAKVNVIVAKAVPATITTDANAVIDAVVGDQVSVTYTVKTADEKAVVGTDIRVRATAAGTVEEEQVLTTDENGQVTFTYTSIDGRTDSLEAVVKEKATLRNTAVTVKWVETAAKVEVVNPEAKGFIFKGATNASAELQTVKYEVTFLDADGNPLADGEQVAVDLTSVTGTLTAGANNTFAGVTSGTITTLVLPANSEGKAVLEFTSDTAEKIKPQFFHDANKDSFLDIGEARANGKEVEIVDGTTQEPTFVLERKAVDADKGINTKVTEVEGGVTVEVGSAVEYTLTATDQYDNPFIGLATFGHKVLLDDLASNDGIKGSIAFNASEVDGVYSVVLNLGTVDFDTVDADADGVVQVKVDAGTAEDATNLVVWFDANIDSELDADEIRIESETIEYIAAAVPVLTSMKITESATTVVADDTNQVTYTVELLDADEKAFDATGKNLAVVIELYQDGVKLDQSASATKVDSATIGTYAAAGENIKVTAIGANDGKFTFTVLPAKADAGSAFNPVVYLDVNKDGVIQVDETMTATGATFTATAEPNSYKAELLETEVTAGETVDVKITALDTTLATEVNFDGEHVVTVLLAADTSSSLAPAKTYLRTANFVDGVATVSVPVELIVNDDVHISITVNGTTKTANVGPDGITGDLDITAAAESKLAIAPAPANSVIVADEFGNLAKYSYTGLAKATNVAGTFSLTPDAEGNVLVKIVDGVVFASDGSTNVTFVKAGADAATLTLTINGIDFVVTLP